MEIILGSIAAAAYLAAQLGWWAVLAVPTAAAAVVATVARRGH